MEGRRGDHYKFTLPHPLIRYCTTEDPRILLEFPMEERELLRQLLQIEELGEK